MTPRAQGLFRDALALPVEERAKLAAELLASLDADAVDDPKDVEAAWAAEIEQRAAHVMAGNSKGTPWDDVRAGEERRSPQAVNPKKRLKSASR